MEFLKYFIIFVLTIYLLVILSLAVRSKKAFKFLFLNAIVGLFVLLMLYFTRIFTGLNLAINKLTVALSGIFGIVGIIALLFLNLII